MDKQKNKELEFIPSNYQVELWRAIVKRLDSGLPEWRKSILAFKQVDAVSDRHSGRRWTDTEFFEALLLSILSNSIAWSKIETVRPDLPQWFNGYNLQWYASRSPQDLCNIVNLFKAKKSGSLTLRKSLPNLQRAIGKLLDHARMHGSIEKYFCTLGTADRPDLIALKLSDGQDKLPGLGVALAAEFLKNVGFDVGKPDRHVNRALGCFNLVHFNKWTESTEDMAKPLATRTEASKVMLVIRQLADCVNEYAAFLDNAIWLLCAEKKSGLHLTNSNLRDISASVGS